jgi:hypothetical protein
MEKNIFLLNQDLKQNSIPLHCDEFNIILSLLDLHSLINFSKTCRKHNELSKSNLIWKNQMIQLCPALKIYYDSRDNNSEKFDYVNVVKELVLMNKRQGDITTKIKELPQKYNIKYFNININLLKNTLQEMLIIIFFFNEYKIIQSMLVECLKKGIICFDKENIKYIFLMMCRTGNIELIKLMLILTEKKSEMVNIRKCFKSAIYICCGYDFLNIAELLLDIVRNNSEEKEFINLKDELLINGRFCELITYKQLKFLLNYNMKYPETLNIETHYLYLLLQFCRSGYDSNFELLLKYYKKNPINIKKIHANNYNYGNIYTNFVSESPFVCACNYVCNDKVQILLKYSKDLLSIKNEKMDTETIFEIFSPGAQDNMGFIIACTEGYYNIVLQLLEYSVEYPNIINLSARGNEGFIKACSNGHTLIVKAMLHHYVKYPETINIEPCYKESLLNACIKRRTNVVILLLNFLKKMKGLEYINNLIKKESPDIQSFVHRCLYEQYDSLESCSLSYNLINNSRFHTNLF